MSYGFDLLLACLEKKAVSRYTLNWVLRQSLPYSRNILTAIQEEAPVEYP
jgi:hypothetical protein